MSAKAYANEITRLIRRLEADSLASIILAAEAIAARSATATGSGWRSRRTACTRRHRTGGRIHRRPHPAGRGPRPARRLRPHRLAGRHVGEAITFTAGLPDARRAVIALTNVEFEDDPRTLLEHPSRTRLHEVADIVVDVPGPLGDGVFEVEELDSAPSALGRHRHDGDVDVFSEALADPARRRDDAAAVPVREHRGRGRQDRQIAGYLESTVGVLAEDEAEAAVATDV